MPLSLDSPRLHLRRFTLDDEAALVALDSDPAVMRWLSGGAATAAERIRHDILPLFLSHDEAQPHTGFWAAETAASGHFVGWFSLRPTEATGRELALGFRLCRAVWGQGLATEGAQWLIQRAFAQPAVARIVATTYEENHQSERVLQKLGFRLLRRYRLSADRLAQIDTFEAGSGELWPGDDLDFVLERGDGR